MVKAKINEDLFDKNQQIWKLIEFGLQSLAIGLFQMEKRFFFLPISIARIKINFVKNFDLEEIYCVGKTQLNNEELSNFAGGSVDILDGENNKLMIIEGVVAKKFEEKENKNEEKINFEEWLMLIRPEKDIAILGVSGTFSGCEYVEEFWEAIRDVRLPFSDFFHILSIFSKFF